MSTAGDFLSELIIKVVGVIFCVIFIANFGIAIGTENILLFWGEKIIYTI